MSGQRIAEFDIWREGYANATVEIRAPGSAALVPVFYDIDLTQPAPNPVDLESYFDVSGGCTVGYGKFPRPLYTAATFVLRINSTDESGVVQQAISELDAQDASRAIAKPSASGYSRALQETLSNSIFAADYGPLGTSPADTTATLEKAIGQAAAAGGGDVLLPAGSLEFTKLTIPARVRLVGQGKGSTILKSQAADRVVTLGGDNAGLRRLTLDGISLVPNSIGVYMDAGFDPVFDETVVKRFSTGIHARGLRQAVWADLDVDNCLVGVKLHGDTNVPAGAIGGDVLAVTWFGGKVSTCLTTGIDISYEDTTARSIEISGVVFDENSGVAVRVNGGQYVRLTGCTWDGNIGDLKIEDDDLAVTRDDAKIRGVFITGGRMRGGTIALEDTLEDVVFSGLQFADVDFTLTAPAANVLLLNCTQDADCTLSGDSTKLVSFTQNAQGNVVGRTTDANPTKAWSSGRMEPGSLMLVEAIGLGYAQTATSKAVYRKHAKFHRPGSTLAYDGQTVNFTVSKIVTGQTSGAKGIIIADTDSGVTGTLTLRALNGIEFIDNEPLLDESGGAAFANGVLAHQAVAQLGTTESIGTDNEDVAGWDLTIVAVAQEAEVRVTGAASTTIDWLVDVRVTRSG